MRLIDTHAHLDDRRFAEDLESTLQRALANGVEKILTIGIDRSTSANALALAKQHAMLHAVIGIQPNQLSDMEADDWPQIVAWSKTEPSIVAIGESGLDRYWDRAPFPLQIEYFDKHLSLARELALPIVIHCREAEADVVEVLSRHYAESGPIRGVMHSYSGDAATAEKCLSFGLHISFAGMVTYKTAQNLRDIAKTVPNDRILVETDSPYLAPVPKRGQRNEPSYVKHTAELLADVRGEEPSAFGAQTTQNALELFRLT